MTSEWMSAGTDAGPLSTPSSKLTSAAWLALESTPSMAGMIIEYHVGAVEQRVSS